MNQRTPNQIGAEARMNYAATKSAQERVEGLMRVLNVYATGARQLEAGYQEGRVAKAELAAKIDALQGMAVAVEAAKVEERQTVDVAAEHYRAHEGTYHDLAVIEAYLGGVAIEVQQPLELGEQAPEVYFLRAA